MAQAAIVTLAIGEEYLSRWQKYCEAGWRAYAQKHGLDLLVVTEPLDDSPLAQSRSAAWQKCLVLSQDFVRAYRQVVLMDCDIAINHVTAPDITQQVDEEYVGGVIGGSQIQEDLIPVLHGRLLKREFAYECRSKRWYEDQDSLYLQFGLAPTNQGMVQTGVLVASPQHHRGLFERVYGAAYPIETRSYEQTPLSHALLTAGVIRRIDSRFNSLFYETMLVHYPYLHPSILDRSAPEYSLLARYATRVQYDNNFFLHFAYDADFMQYLRD